MGQLIRTGGPAARAQRGQLSPCGAWPDWARASCFPQPCAPSFRAHSDGRRAGTVDGHHPQHSGVSLRPPTYDLRVDATVSTWVVGHLWTLFPVPLCPMCAQMSTNAASRTGGATKYATTSRAASTAPATAATRSPPTAGPAKVRPGCGLAQVSLLVSLLPSSLLLPTFTFAVVKSPKLAVTFALLAVAVSFGSGGEGRREEGCFAEGAHAWACQ